MSRTHRRYHIAVRLIVFASLLLSLFATAAPASAAQGDPPGYFSETGFRVCDAKFYEYFNARGNIRTFGYPVSRCFTLDGFKVQIFQRRVLQLGNDGQVNQLNLLDDRYLPYTRFNGATFPAADQELIQQAPAPGSPGYAEAILAFVRQNAPNQVNSTRTNFYGTFSGSVTMAEAYPRGGGNQGLLQGIWLEMWGVPISRPAADPNNSNFVYQRFQRGIMHFDATTGTTQGILLGDYLKSLLTGVGLPADLADQAKDSPYLNKYDNSQPNGIRAGQSLPNSDLKDAFEKEPPAAAPGATGQASAPTQPTTPAAPAPSNLAGGPLRYGWQAHLWGQPQQRIFDVVRDSGFGWVKQQVRWATHNFNDSDQAVAAAEAAGVKLLFSVVTTPPALRGGHGEDGPPHDYAEFGKFMGGLAARYKSRVHAYELWNEQNFSREWGGGQINACDYIRLLREGYAAVKAADPNAVVVSGALTPTGVNNPALAVDDKLFLEQMYQCNGGEFLRIADAVGTHATGFNNAPDDAPGQQSVDTPGFKGHMSFYFKRIDDLYEVMRKYNDPRPMWITEFHWASARPPVPSGYEWATHLNEEQWSNFMVRAFQMLRERPWVGAAFVWNLNFRTFQNYHNHETAIFGFLGNPNDEYCNCPADWTPRRAFNALKAMPK